MVNVPQIAPYGTWTSPITAKVISGNNVHFEGLQTSTNQIYLLESRPAEGGRFCIVEFLDSGSRDVLPREYSAMSTVHEYGGGSFALDPSSGHLIFTSHPHNGVFSLDPSTSAVTPIVLPSAHIRFADFSVIPGWILAVQEVHSNGKVENSVVAINTTLGTVYVVAQGADFYAHPQFDLNRQRICWMEWSHPDMPWTGTILYTAPWVAAAVSNGSRVYGEVVAGEAGTESICQPRWGPDGTLFFVSDRTGYWQLYRLDQGLSEPRLVNLKGLEKAEFGSRESYLGNCTYIALTSNLLVAAVTKLATSSLVLIDLVSETYSTLPVPFVEIQKNALRALSPTTFLAIGITPSEPQAIYRIDLTSPTTTTLLKTTLDLRISSSFYSISQHVTFPRSSNPTHVSHAIFVPPQNPNFLSPPDAKPPLIVWMHGGPTSHISPSLSVSTQYWTSRGYAYVYVNHGGSTGYGRAYRAELQGQWGILDVSDAADCVAYLASQGLIDASHVGIVGESAGGYAVLQALVTYPDLWAGGISLYGVSNLQALIAAMHKFESQYVQQLIIPPGVTLAVDAVYKARSPCFHAERIVAPLLLLQGDKDTVVPEAQSWEMERVVRENGGDVKVVVYEGEGHGWHKAETIRAALETQTEFWARTLL